MALAHESRKIGNLKLAVKSRGENLVAFLPKSCDEGGGKEITCCLDFFLLLFTDSPAVITKKKGEKKNSSSLVSGFWKLHPTVFGYILPKLYSCKFKIDNDSASLSGD